VKITITKTTNAFRLHLISVRRNEVASQLFIDNKNPSQIACTVSYANIYPIPQFSTVYYSVLKDNIGVAALATLGKVTVNIDRYESALHVANADHLTFIPPPPVAISFEGKEQQDEITFVVTCIQYEL
jgi:hypothetical protein